MSDETTRAGQPDPDGPVFFPSYVSGVTWQTASGNQSGAYFGNTAVISIERFNSTYLHRVEVMVQGTSVYDQDGLTNAAYVTLNRSFMAHCPNSATSTVTVRVITRYLHDSGVWKDCGTTYYSMQVKMPDDVKPTISGVTLSDPSGYHDEYGVYVSQRSDLKATIAASGAYGSTITGYKVSIGSDYGGGNFISVNGPTIYALPAGTVTVTSTVMDSRGRYAQHTQTIQVEKYDNPRVETLKAVRVDSSGDEDDEGTYIQVTARLFVCTLGDASNNTSTVKLATSTDGGAYTDKQTVTYDTSGEKTFTSQRLSGYSAEKQHRVRLTLTDDFGFESVAYATVDTATPVLDFRSDGKGLGVFSVSTEDGLEVGGNTTLKLGHRVLNQCTNLVNTSSLENNPGHGSNGYVKVLRLTSDANGSYQNKPISLTVSSRGKLQSKLVFYMNNVSDNRLIPTQGNAICIGSDIGAIIVRDSETEISIWVKKSESYDVISVDDFTFDSTYMPYLSYEFPMTFSEDQPYGDEGMTPFYLMDTKELVSFMRGAVDSSSGIASSIRSVISKNYLLDAIYPVGSIYLSVSNTSPSSLFGGAWTRLSGGFLYAGSSSQTMGTVGGSTSKTISLSNMPAHAHQLYMYKNSREGSAYSSHGIVYNNAFGGRIMVEKPSLQSYTESVTQTRGSGTAIDVTPTYIRVAVWRRTS